MPLIQRPGGGASAAGAAAAASGVAGVTVDPAAGAAGAVVCALAADIAAAIPAAATQPAAPLTFLFPMCRRHPYLIALIGVHEEHRFAAPLIVSRSIRRSVRRARRGRGLRAPLPDRHASRRASW